MSSRAGHGTLSIALPFSIIFCSLLCCLQLLLLLDRMNTPDERLLVVLTCCARLVDAVEADDQGLFREMEKSGIDKLNQKR